MQAGRILDRLPKRLQGLLHLFRLLGRQFLQVLRDHSRSQDQHVLVQLEQRGELRDEEFRGRVAAVALDCIHILRRNGVAGFFLILAAASFWFSPAARRASAMIEPNVFMDSALGLYGDQRNRT